MASRLIGALLAFSATGIAQAADSDWQGSLTLGARHATAQREGQAYRLSSDGGARSIPAPADRADTASPLVDALFAMAQAEANDARVTALRDGAYNHGEPIPCDCYVTGVKWPFVWTRDSAYSIDLGLARLDAPRARRTLDFKLSGVRVPTAPQGLYVVQDTGSGGSWPISTDRVAWFLGARNLLDDRVFAQRTFTALRDTLAQDRLYVFNAALGLYRGETSFLDWREQTYPLWTENAVGFIAESFSLSTNVLHLEALRLAARLATAQGDRAAAQTYTSQANALREAIDRRFWREDRGLYMSYLGAPGDPQQIEAYDLLGTALAILADVPATPARARRALASYPTWPAGSPVIWPEHHDAAIYHNRAIWPFVSAYALRAARKLDDPARIAHELRSILQGAALGGSNYENYEVATGAVHVEEGRMSGPVVNSPRQLWSVAAMVGAVSEGVFGLELASASAGTKDGMPGGTVAIGARYRLAPKIPRDLVPMLFGTQPGIALAARDCGCTIELRLPASLADSDNLLVLDREIGSGRDTRRVFALRGTHVDAAPLRTAAPEFAPDTPAFLPTQPKISDGSRAALRFWLDGNVAATWTPGSDTPLAPLMLAESGLLQSLWTTRVDPASQLESLPGPIVHLGAFEDIDGAWPRHWTATRGGRYALRLRYDNRNGPINTGVTAAVKQLVVACTGAPAQRAAVVMPHNIETSLSTEMRFEAPAGAACTFTLEEGFNMSFLARNALYTGEKGGASGPLNEAQIAQLRIVALP